MHYIHILLFISTANAWAPSMNTGSRSSSIRTGRTKMTWCLKLSSPKNESSNEVTCENKNVVEWGVSYIGGDPCGSKYNEDPFDKKPSKPGFPDDMKARIEALAQEKKRRSEDN
mmetsp:Transcript_4275/g.8179  ORF Transcript_4275/g.8179 Transcript_4275/m.8179 type:complete len:114 (-) Transcript_4275:19-360(-)